MRRQTAAAGRPTRGRILLDRLCPAVPRHRPGQAGRTSRGTPAPVARDRRQSFV